MSEVHDHRPICITVLGAGSKFTPTLTRDILCIPGAESGEIRLCDIDEARLGPMAKIVSRVAESSGKPRWKVIASTDRRQLLPGSHYVINCIEVSGLQCVQHDNDIPLRYGIDQCIGDTIGPGGLFKGLRTIPVYLDFLRDIRELCPDALMLNYTNPMGMLCVAAGRGVPEVQTVGLCHSVQGTSHLLAKRAGVKYEEMQWECAGINHLAWFTKLEHKGRDLYPTLMEKARQDIAGNPSDPEDAKDLVRKDMTLHFGAFITESSGHLSEYLPYYRKRKDLYPKYIRDGYDGGSRFYATEWPRWRQETDQWLQKLLHGEEPLPKMERSWEYASWIIEAAETNRPYRIYGNVMNICPRSGRGPLIENLPHDGCVEVACDIDRKGVHPMAFGALPAQMAAMCDSNMRMITLASEAAMEKSIEKAIYALMLDPLTAACCCPAEIKAMALEMFAAEKEFLPGYA